jgi:eukaryotic-like serine/threonine-protein kinase
MAIAASATTGSDAPRPAVARLRDRWDILIDMPLGELRGPTAQAYAVEDHRSVGMSFFALVVDPKQPIRGPALGLSRMNKHPHVLTPIEYGTVDWPPAQQRCLAIIYERPAGGRLAPASDQNITPWSEDDIIDRVIAGLLPGLRALNIEGMTHRGIRPTNIFFRDAARRQAVLGDCIAALPAAHQPMAYETIESAMAIPGARGNGSSADDLYALGVLCLHLSQGTPPGQGFAGELLIEEKIRRGSFNALAADARLNPGLLELLRGLLIDEPDERWTLQDVDSWLQGRRLTPKVTSPAPRAPRPFEFAAEPCFTARSLGRALARNAEQGVHAVRSHALQVWLQRSLGDRAVAEGVAQALADGEDPASGNATQDARLVARVAIALDPGAPIRYRGTAIAIDGLGPALAAAMLGGGDLKLPAEILLARLPQFWCQRQPPARAEFQAQLREYDRLRRILEDIRPGLGIERLTYELNPGLHCLSPFVLAGHVTSLAELLPALELAAAGGQIQAQPIDRHIAAFVAHRSKKIDEGALVSVGSLDPTLRLLGMLHLLTVIQHERGPAALPALTQVFGRQAQLLINRFRNRRTRERLENELVGVLTEASLPKLLNFLDNAEEKQIDNYLFSKARNDFNMANRAIDRCEQERARLPDEAEQTASAIAAGLSMLVGVFAVMASILAFGSF